MRSLRCRRIERLLLLGARRVGGGSSGAGELAGDRRTCRRGVGLVEAASASSAAADEHHQHQAREIGEVDLEVEALHRSGQSCSLANT